jgi:hypothetical protein
MWWHATGWQQATFPQEIEEDVSLQLIRVADGVRLS